MSHLINFVYPLYSYYDENYIFIFEDNLPHTTHSLYRYCLDEKSLNLFHTFPTGLYLNSLNRIITMYDYINDISEFLRQLMIA